MSTERSNYSYQCGKCSDSGWIIAFHKASQERFGFRCGWCKTAERAAISKNIPVWSSHFTEKFESFDRWWANKGWLKKESAA